MKVLKKRARDISKLLVPYEPTEVLQQLNDILTSQPDSQIRGIHFFPLGGIKATSKWIMENQ